MVRRFVALGVLTILVLSMSAFAQSIANTETMTAEDKKKQAQRLFESGLRDKAQGKFSTACPLLDKALELVPNHLNTAIAVAQCYHDAGLFLTASKRYTRALEAASIQPRQNNDKIEMIQKGQVAVTARISYIRVHVLGAVGSLDGVAISVDGAPIDPQNWGGEIPVDRGIYKVRATAAGRVPRTIPININVDGEIFEVVFDKLDVDLAVPPPPPTPSISTRSPAPSAATPPTKKAIPTMKVPRPRPERSAPIRKKSEASP